MVRAPEDARASSRPGCRRCWKKTWVEIPGCMGWVWRSWMLGVASVSQVSRGGCYLVRAAWSHKQRPPHRHDLAATEQRLCDLEAIAALGTDDFELVALLDLRG